MPAPAIAAEIPTPVITAAKCAKMSVPPMGVAAANMGVRDRHVGPVTAVGGERRARAKCSERKKSKSHHRILESTRHSAPPSSRAMRATAIDFTER